jgi:hypothetical protein
VGDEAVDLRITTKCDGEAGEGVLRVEVRGISVVRDL